MTKYLLLDLDNTLYSCRHGLEEENRARIAAFSGAFLGINPEDVWPQRWEHREKYGTTLEWLMCEKGFTDIEAYVAAVHPANEADALPADPGLRAFLENIHIPKAVITNSFMEHTRNILDKLQFNGLFTHVFDIRHFGFKGKPHHSAYKTALQEIGMDAADVLFIDDNPVFTKGFISMGGRAVLLDENNFFVNYPHAKIKALEEFTRYL